MDKQAIEQTAVGTVERRVNLTRFLSSYLDRNDKTPSWDGSIYLYYTEEKSADNLIGRVHAQIKGHECSDFSKNEIGFNVKIYHLRNYLNDGGAMFFVVYLCPNEAQTDFNTKVYYSELPPAKITDIISKCRTNQQSVSIKLKQLPQNADDFASIVWNCYENCKKQASFAGVKLPTVEELSTQGVLESLQMFVSAYGESRNALKALMKFETPIYAKIKGSAIPHPVIVEEMVNKSCYYDVEEDVTVDGVFFYSNYRVIVTAETITIQIGQSVSIITIEGIPGCKIVIDLTKKLRGFVLDASFVIAFLEVKKLYLGESVYDFSNDIFDLTGIDLGKMEKDQLRFSRYVRMLDLQGCYEDIDCSLLTSEDWLNLERLTTATLDEIPIQGMRDDLLPYMAMSVGKLKFAIGLFQDSKEKDTYSILHIQDCDDILFQPEDSDRVSFFPICAVLQKEDYKELSNIKFDRILPSLKSYTERSENYNVVNEIMLRIIAASDITSGARKAILLKTAMEIAEWLLSLPSDIWEKRIAVINKLQITARQRELCDEERGVLYAMIAISNDRRDILFAANALLGKREDAHQHFMLLPKAVQAELCNYPIYRFL